MSNLGISLYYQKDLGGAIQYYEKAIALDPDYAMAYSNLGLALRDYKDLEGAVKHFRATIDLNPKNAQAHGVLGQALLQQGLFAEARDATRQFLKLLPLVGPARLRR